MRNPALGSIELESVGCSNHRPNRPCRPRSSEPIQNRHLLVARAQVFRQEVQVALGRSDLRMTQHHREPHNVATLAQVVRCERVAEAMPSKARQTKLVLEEMQTS
jgi:hypothetical protein